MAERPGPSQWMVEPGPRRLAALLCLRHKRLREEGGVERWRRAGGLAALLRLLRAEDGPGLGGTELDLVLSALADCCTERRARREVHRLGGIPLLAAILKENCSQSVQNRAARALGNLAQEREASVTIHQSGAVTPLIRLLSTADDALCLESASRALRLLCDSPAHRRSLLSQGCLPPLLSLLGRGETGLLSACCRALSQLLSSPCPPASSSPLLLHPLAAPGGLDLLATLADSHPRRRVREGALSALAALCSHPSLRPGVGAADGARLLSQALQEGRGSRLRLRALCLLCREAVNRPRVREAGGLRLLLERLRASQGRDGGVRLLAGALLCFCYDQASLDLLTSWGLVPVLVRALGAAGVEQRGRREEEDEEQEEEDVGPQEDSFDFPPERDVRVEQDEASSSFLSLRSWLLSEGLIDTPGDLSPCAAGPPPDPEGLPPPARSLRQLLPCPETPVLLLLSRLSQAEVPPAGLLSEGSLRVLLAYARRGRPDAPRCYRLLSRLACNPNCLLPLLRSRAAPLIRASLHYGLWGEKLSPGDGAGDVSPWLRELGEVLLHNLGAQAESAFGVGTLTHLLLSGPESDRTSCIVALPLLCRNEAVRRKLLIDHGGLPQLLRALVSTEDPLTAFGADEAVRELAGGWAAGVEGEGGGGEEETEGGGADCPYQELLSRDGGDVSLVLDCGVEARALRQRLTEGSPVFRAMLTGPFAESSASRVPLRGLPPEGFLPALHYLHGCRPAFCPSLRPPSPPDGRPLDDSALGGSLAAAGRFLLPGLATRLQERALSVLSHGRLPELRRFADTHAFPSLGRAALRRMLRASVRPGDRVSAWRELGRTVPDLEALLSDLHSLLLEYL